LLLVFLGRSHSSSDVHRKVIAELENAGPENRKIADLRKTAERSRDAIYASDFASFGRAMIENTEAQARLHPDLVSAHAQKVIAIARKHGAVGWKVNGAGGEGGSLTILCGHVSQQKRRLVAAVEAADPLFKNIPIYLSRYGLRTWEGAVARKAHSRP
jgi:D-glycero-alpha-D-manno-heptose-7-phosphate kinase